MEKRKPEDTTKLPGGNALKRKALPMWTERVRAKKTGREVSISA